MPDIVFTNNASALLQTSIIPSDTTIEVESGFGGRFPLPSGGTYFYATLEDSSGNFEVVRCTSRSTNLLTVIRGQDNTTALSFTAGTTRVELRLVTAVVEEFIQANGDSMTGNLLMGGNEIQNAVLTGASTAVLAGEIAGVPIRGATGVTGNEITVPADGVSRPSAGAREILLANDPDEIVAELDTAGTIILNSATTGVRIPASAWLRVEGSTTAEYIQLTHDDTDALITGANATDLQITGFSGAVQIVSGTDLDLNDDSLLQAVITDFSLGTQAVSTPGATTTVDYTAGSYVNLTLTQNSTLAFSNLPASGLASLRFKVIQDGLGPHSLSFPAGTQWPQGEAPTITQTINAIDFVDLWTDDGGTTWYGAFVQNFSAP